MPRSVEVLEARRYLNKGSDMFFILIPRTEDAAEHITAELLRQTLIIHQLSAPYLPEFDETLSDQSIPSPANPWLAEYYESLFGCKLGKGYPYDEICKKAPKLTSSKLYKQDRKIGDAINYVYIMADVVHRTLVRYCGRNYSGICQNISTPSVLRMHLKETIQQMSVEDERGKLVQLDKDGVRMPEYEIVLRDRSNNIKKMIYTRGTLSGSGGDWRGAVLGVVSGCSPYCSRCTGTSSVQEYRFIDGDLIIGGLFDVHVGNGGVTCGGVNTKHGYELTEAFNYAIAYINRKKGMFSDKLPDITLGTLSLDVCQSPARTISVVCDALSGSLNATGVDVRSKLLGFIGPFRGEAFSEVSRLLGEVGLPLISYGSQASASSRFAFGALRAAPSVSTDADAIVAVIRWLGLRCVQAVYSRSSYGRTAFAAFVNAARADDICIAQNVSFYPGNNATVGALLNYPTVRVVVILLDDSDIRHFLLAFGGGRSALKQFRLIASQTWADEIELPEGEHLTLSAITTGVQSSYIKQFDEYLETTTPENNMDNSWFEEYYQSVFSCGLDNGGLLQTRCTSNKSLVEYPNYMQDRYAIYTINSVFAFALALHDTLNEICGEKKGICQSFREKVNPLLYEKLKKTTFTDLSGASFAFLPDGSSNKGIDIYSLSTHNGSVYYKNIGSYSDSRHLNISPSVKPAWSSYCDDCCNDCENDAASFTESASISSPFGLHILAFMPVHKSSSRNPWMCGEIDGKFGFQNMVAFFYAIRRINNGLDLPAALKLGGTVLDTCGNSLSVMKNAVELVSSSEGSPTTFGHREDYIGYLAMEHGDVNVLREVTRIAPSVIVSPSLMPADPSASESFVLRTKSSEQNEGKVMAEIARRLFWIYVAVIRSHGVKRTAADAFLKDAVGSDDHLGICVAMYHTMPYGSRYADALDIVDAAQGVVGLNVLVVFTSQHDTRLLLRAVADLKLEGRFTFLGSTNWGDNIQVGSGLGHVARGSIVVQSHAEHLAGFASFLESLNLNSHDGIPRDWFEEFWQREKRCRLENASKPLVEFKTKCPTDDRLSFVEQDNSVLYTLIATHMLALGLNGIRECVQRQNATAACIRSLPDGVQSLYEATKNASWRSPAGLLGSNKTVEFKFTENGFGSLGFTVVGIAEGYASVAIGHSEDWDIVLDISRYKTNVLHAAATSPTQDSQCPYGKPCTCVRRTGQNGRGGRMARNTDNVRLEPSRAFDSSISTTWGLACIVLSGCGIALALVLFLYLLVDYPDRGGTSVLGYLLLFSVMLIYAVNFAFLVDPDRIVCDVRRSSLGFVYALSFGCMLIKVLLIWQQRDGVALTYTRLKHPASLLVIAVGLALVQAAIAVEWIVLAPSKAEVLLDGGQTIRVCAPSGVYNAELVISCVYVMLLMALTFVFSAVTYNSHVNNRESRWILAVTCLHIIVWTAWATLSCRMDYAYRDAVIVAANLLNASAILGLIYVRKLYLLTKYVKEVHGFKAEHRGTLTEQTKGFDKGTPRETVTSFIYPNTIFDVTGSVRSGKSSERFYFAPNERGGEM